MNLDDPAAIITALAKGYTRGRGFVGGAPAEDLAAVIATASARLAANPEQVGQTTGPFHVDAGFTGWTLPELAVLNRYRKRAT